MCILRSLHTTRLLLRSDAATDKKSYEPDVEAILEYVEELKKLKGPR